ncbi:MAG: PEGA domain-containing protein [Polyangiaceae bacterium]|nr:PEGA domain-containing protein [Polyangiaceae bacterium]
MSRTICTSEFLVGVCGASSVTRHRCRVLLLAAALSALLLAAPAGLGVSSAVAAPEPAARAEAQRLFEQGKRAAHAKQWNKALDLFRRAYAVVPSYDVAANLGHVALKLNKNAEASRYLWISLHGFPPSETQQRRQSIQELYDTAKRSSATVLPELEPKNADVLVDGAELERQPGEPVFLEPGQHFLTAEADGYEPVSQMIEAVAGGELTVKFELPKSSEAPVAKVSSGLDNPQPAPGAAEPNPKSEPVEDPSESHILQQGTNLYLGLILGGAVTLAAAGTGVGYTLSANKSERRAEDLVDEVGGSSGCVDRSSRPAACEQLADAAEAVDRKRNTSYIAFGAAGAVALGTATYLFWPGLTGSGSNSAKVRPTLFVGDGSMHLTVSGRF